MPGRFLFERPKSCPSVMAAALGMNNIAVVIVTNEER